MGWQAGGKAFVKPALKSYKHHKPHMNWFSKEQLYCSVASWHHDQDAGNKLESLSFPAQLTS